MLSDIQTSKNRITIHSAPVKNGIHAMTYIDRSKLLVVLGGCYVSSLDGQHHRAHQVTCSLDQRRCTVQLKTKNMTEDVHNQWWLFQTQKGQQKLHTYIHISIIYCIYTAYISLKEFVIANLYQECGEQSWLRNCTQNAHTWLLLRIQDRYWTTESAHELTRMLLNTVKMAVLA